MTFYGIHSYPGRAPMPRHRHADAYVAVVLSGSYLEAGDDGRLRADAGTVIAHESLSAHRNEFGIKGAVVLNLPAVAPLAGAGNIADVDLLARTAARDVREAAHLLAEQFHPGALSPEDWPDRLANALSLDPDLRISTWADAMGLNPASVSRGFVRAYGVTPKRFRLEVRVRRAVRELKVWQGSFATLAAEHGFADQAHFTRTVRSVTGATPQMLKAKFVQS